MVAKLPIGVQDFAKLRSEGYKYIDKTGVVYRLAKSGCYYFLSRPRRFGKSLFLSTLEAYFLGKKELFTGLEIEYLEKDWIEYPVLHLDLNTQDYRTTEALNNKIDREFSLYKLGYPNKEVEEHTSRGRMDMTVRTDKYIYIFEFKFNASAQTALKQIEEMGYADKFKEDDRAVICIGVNYCSAARNIDSWLVSPSSL